MGLVCIQNELPCLNLGCWSPRAKRLASRLPVQWKKELFPNSLWGRRKTQPSHICRIFKWKPGKGPKSPRSKEKAHDPESSAYARAPFPFPSHKPARTLGKHMLLNTTNKHRLETQTRKENASRLNKQRWEKSPRFSWLYRAPPNPKTIHDLCCRAKHSFHTRRIPSFFTSYLIPHQSKFKDSLISHQSRRFHCPCHGITSLELFAQDG